MHFADLIVAAAEAHDKGAIMRETLIYPIIALIAFAALALVTFSYRDVANRHAAKAEAYARRQGAAHGGETGHGH